MVEMLFYKWSRGARETWLIFIISLIAWQLVACSSVRKTPGHQTVSQDAIHLPIGGNSWKNGEGKGRVTNKGIQNWQGEKVSFTTYIRLGKTGNLKVWIPADLSKGKSKLAVSINGKTRPIEVIATNNHPIYAGIWKIKDTGYVKIKLRGISKSVPVFANINELLLSGTATEGKNAFTKNNQGNFFYWGRRGPSVHLSYSVPKKINAEWFYNEVTVPKGSDILGSYFMADGFRGGYFGMQVNSPTRRHILFSVWSPYKTDNPKDIPEALQIKLLKKGTDVYAGQFGNEGSGGQSYLNFMWKPEHTYKFLLHAVPVDSSHTVYTAYFYPPEKGAWQLIASFKRPKTHSYLKGLHSFLENFSPRQGDKRRKVFFGNQWIRTVDGKWIAINKAKFTTDNTGNKGYRMDFAGGTKGNLFFLKNGGFFDDFTTPYTSFKRTETKEPPHIDFSKLP